MLSFKPASSLSSTTWTAAAAKLLQSCPTLCDPIDGSPPGFAVPGILQATTLEWVAISFSDAWKWKVKVKSLSHVWFFSTPWTAAHQAPPSMGFSRQEYWSGLPLPSLTTWTSKRQMGNGPLDTWWIHFFKRNGLFSPLLSRQWNEMGLCQSKVHASEGLRDLRICWSVKGGSWIRGGCFLWAVWYFFFSLALNWARSHATREVVLE